MHDVMNRPQFAPLFAVLRVVVCVLLSLSTTVSGMNLPPRETPVISKNRVWENFPTPTETPLAKPAAIQQPQWEFSLSATKPASGVPIYANGNPVMMNDPSGNFSMLVWATSLVGQTVLGATTGAAAGAAAAGIDATIEAYESEVSIEEAEAHIKRSVAQGALIGGAIGGMMGYMNGMIPGAGLAVGRVLAFSLLPHMLDGTMNALDDGNYGLAAYRGALSVFGLYSLSPRVNLPSVTKSSESVRITRPGGLSAIRGEIPGVGKINGVVYGETFWVDSIEVSIGSRMQGNSVQLYKSILRENPSIKEFRGEPGGTNLAVLTKTGNINLTPRAKALNQLGFTKHEYDSSINVMISKRH